MRSKFIIIVISGLLAACPVLAGIVPCGVGDGPECTLCHLWQLASNVINFITFNLALSVAPLLFIVAGVLYLTSGGNEAKLKQAQTIFIDTVIGLAMIFSAWLLVDTLLKTVSLGNFKEIIPAWNEFPACQ